MKKFNGLFLWFMAIISFCIFLLFLFDLFGILSIPKWDGFWNNMCNIKKYDLKCMIKLDVLFLILSCICSIFLGYKFIKKYKYWILIVPFISLLLLIILIIATDFNV